jgi:hypothetical protein
MDPNRMHPMSLLSDQNGRTVLKVETRVHSELTGESTLVTNIWKLAKEKETA